jgi:hypothetical protein
MIVVFTNVFLQRKKMLFRVDSLTQKKQKVKAEMFSFATHCGTGFKKTTTILLDIIAASSPQRRTAISV